MKYPTLYTQESSRQMVDTFRGYHHSMRIADGEFYDMKNMTSDHYPVLASRKKRGVYEDYSPTGGLTTVGDCVCWVEGPSLYINGEHIYMSLSTAAENNPKQLIGMGSYLIILPDKKYINVLDRTDQGDIEAAFTTTSDVIFELCDIDGEVYSDTAVSDSAPEDPENLALWIDTSSTPHTLKQYSAARATWVDIATTYIKISAPGIGSKFAQYDGVTISGIAAEELQDLNSTMIVWKIGAEKDYIVVTGILDTVVTQTADEGNFCVERRMPYMDFVMESGNRLWGCRYGQDRNGGFVNEIYASKLGDFKNWNSFMGVSTDSYAASCGENSPFTGSVSHGGYPLFFKENHLFKVYGSRPSDYQIQVTNCNGVQEGCHGSLSTANGVLFYKSRAGVCSYDGSFPVEISSSYLGDETFSSAVGSTNGNKYYISMQGSAGQWHLFVYDIKRGMWHREDSLHAAFMCSCLGEVYCADPDTRRILTLLGSGTKEAEDVVEWMVETGEIGLSSPDMKYVSRLTVRMAMEVGAKAEFYAQYDLDDEWVRLCRVEGTSLRSFSIPIRPRRCDHMRLHIEGTGKIQIYSITKTIEEGSEIS